MPKNIKILKKENEVKKVKDVHEELEEEIEEEEEVLPEDVQEALGINKAEKAARMKEIDYISELENSSDGFDFDEKPSKSSFDDDFDSDIE